MGICIVTYLTWTGASNILQKQVFFQHMFGIYVPNSESNAWHKLFHVSLQQLTEAGTIIAIDLYNLKLLYLQIHFLAKIYL